MIAALAPLWITARAAGIAATLAASCALSCGLLMALKPKRIARWRLELRAAHEALALATVVFLAVHGTSLLLDPVLRPGVVGVLVPGGSAYERFGVALGQSAAYGMLALGLTFYARRRLGGRRWRSAHRVIPLFWALAIVHGLLVGTDARTWWFWAAVAPPVLAGLALLAQRWGPSVLDALEEANEPPAAPPATSPEPPRGHAGRRRPHRPHRAPAAPAGSLWSGEEGVSLEADPFSFVLTRAGELRITRGSDRVVSVLRGAAAARLHARLAQAGEEQTQQLLARATGDYRRGNERR